MTDPIEIQPRGPLRAAIRPPGSKSITNRALVCAALAEGTSTLRGALDSEDTRVMVQSLGRLGVPVECDPMAATMTVTGRGSQVGFTHPSRTELFVGNSGTTVRFLTAMATLGRGTCRLDGVARMRQRPIGDLLDALVQLGADVASEAGTGCPPVIVRGREPGGGLPGGRATIRGDISSQFLSGLLMIGPNAERGVELVVDGPLVSRPYVRMTLAVMAAFGVAVDAGDLARFVVPPGLRYRACRYEVEPDASAASYFWAAAAIAGGEVTVEGLSRDSLQGDVAFCDCLARMGCRVTYEIRGIRVAGRPLTGIAVDMNAISDTVQTLAVVALFATGPTTISGVAHVRHKETDRLAALATELRKLGAAVDEHSDGLTITPAPLHPATIDTYDDHRMAMSLALAGLRTPGVVITDPACTEKTYPGFFRDLGALKGGDPAVQV